MFSLLVSPAERHRRRPVRDGSVLRSMGCEELRQTDRATSEGAGARTQWRPAHCRLAAAEGGGGGLNAEFFSIRKLEKTEHAPDDRDRHMRRACGTTASESQSGRLGQRAALRLKKWCRLSLYLPRAEPSATRARHATYAWGTASMESSLMQRKPMNYAAAAGSRWRPPRTVDASAALLRDVHP